jgi:hypothetical protein
VGRSQVAHNNVKVSALINTIIDPQVLFSRWWGLLPSKRITVF